MTVNITPYDRQRWQGRRRAADRALKQYPTILVDTDLVIIVDNYLAAVESSNQFLRDQMTQPAEATS